MHIYLGRPEGPRKLGPAAWAGHWSFWPSVVWSRKTERGGSFSRGDNNMTMWQLWCMFVFLHFICQVWRANHLVQMSSCIAETGHCTFNWFWNKTQISYEASVKAFTLHTLLWIRERGADSCCWSVPCCFKRATWTQFFISSGSSEQLKNANTNEKHCRSQVLQLK